MIYQHGLSPVLHAVVPGAGCRFSPSCSNYAREALQVHGAWKGLRLAVFRILRCHPLHRGGYDPVPPKHGG